MSPVLKEAFSKLENKLDYNDETDLTDKEIASLLKYVNNLEKSQNKVKTYCNNKIKNSLESEFDDTKRKDRLFTETIIELQCIMQIIDEYSK